MPTIGSSRSWTRSTTFPPGFEPHPKLARILAARRTQFDGDQVDWALAEALAFGSLLLEGTPVRVAGQDTRRGTFSQRHAVVVDHRTEEEYTPLANLGADAAPFMIYDSVLSEFAAVGFEYGYSVSDHDTLVCWEAQFGDFANGAQTIIDQFVVAAEDKWGQHSGLVMLLPHGFEGQGPEHSSARLERFLVLCAQDNIRVVYPTTAAQYFHLLRRQVRDRTRKPLVVMTPKRYLRMPATVSPVAAFTAGGFQPVLDDPAPPAEVKRVVFCTGKFGHELIARRDAEQAPVAVVRIEELYPWPRGDRGGARALSRRGGVLGAGGAGQHGRALLRPAPARRGRGRPARRRRRPRRRARARRRAAPRCTTPSNKHCSTPRSVPRSDPERPRRCPTSPDDAWRFAVASATATPSPDRGGPMIGVVVTFAPPDEFELEMT